MAELVDDNCDFTINCKNSGDLPAPSGRHRKNGTIYLRKREACLAGPAKNAPKSPEKLEIMANLQM